MNVHYEPPVSSIAERLKEAMDIRGLTAAELSRATKITTASPHENVLQVKVSFFAPLPYQAIARKVREVHKKNKQ